MIKGFELYFIIGSVLVFLNFCFYALIWQIAPIAQVAGNLGDGAYLTVSPYILPLSHAAFVIGLLIAGGFIVAGFRARKRQDGNDETERPQFPMAGER